MARVKLIILFLLVNHLVSVPSLKIETANAGNIDTYVKKNKDPEQYYTPLLDYGILPSENVSLSFSVKACDNAFLLLSSTKNLNNCQTYEIVFGAGPDGEKDILFLHKNGVRLDMVNNFSFLKCNDFTHISVYSSGAPTRELRIDLEDQTYTRTDENSFKVDGYGIMTAYGSDGVWLFDQEITTESNNVQPRVQIAESTIESNQCRCVCNKSSNNTSQNKYKHQLYGNLTKEEWLQIKIESIHRELKLNKTQLSSSRRKKFCAADDRKSSKQIGIVAAMFILSVVSLVVLIDVVETKKHVRVMRKIWDMDK